jgi:hypothetical protein
MHSAGAQARMGRDQYGVGAKRMADRTVARNPFHHAVFAERGEIAAIELRWLGFDHVSTIGRHYSSASVRPVAG